MEFPRIYRKKIVKSILLLIGLGLIAFFDRTLAFGAIFAVFLALITFLGFDLIGAKSRLLFFIFIVAFIFHFLAAIVVSYVYPQFSDILIEKPAGHFYSLFMEYLYAFTTPHMLIAKIFNAWLAALIVVAAYLAILEAGGSRLGGLLAAMAINAYPGLIVSVSLFSEDTLTALLAACGLFFIVKLMKKFSWRNLIVLYLVSGALMQLRPTFAIAVILSFVACWFLFAGFPSMKRISYGTIFTILLGLLALGTVADGLPLSGEDYLKALWDNALRPLPWQAGGMGYFFVVESVAWFSILAAAIGCAIIAFKDHAKRMAPFIILSLAVVGIGALFPGLNGFHARLPAAVSLLCIVPFAFDKFTRPVT